MYRVAGRQEDEGRFRVLRPYMFGFLVCRWVSLSLNVVGYASDCRQAWGWLNLETRRGGARNSNRGPGDPPALAYNVLYCL